MRSCSFRCRSISRCPPSSSFSLAHSATGMARPIALASVAIFILATFGCIFAQTIETFLVFRMIQASAAVGFVVSRAISATWFFDDRLCNDGHGARSDDRPIIGGALDGAFAGSRHSGSCGGRSGCLGGLFDGLGETASGDGKSFAAQVRDYPELLTSRRFWGYVFCAAFASGAFFAFLGGAPFVASKGLVWPLSSRPWVWDRRLSFLHLVHSPWEWHGHSKRQRRYAFRPTAFGRYSIWPWRGN